MQTLRTKLSGAVQKGSVIGLQVQTGPKPSVSANLSFVVIFEGNKVWQVDCMQWIDYSLQGDSMLCFAFHMVTEGRPG
jgi:hypothetical protein